MQQHSIIESRDFFSFTRCWLRRNRGIWIGAVVLQKPQGVADFLVAFFFIIL